MFDKIFEAVVCPEDCQVKLATFYLRQEADLWWKFERPACKQDPKFSWESLKDKLRERFYPAHVKAYHKKFLELAHFASVLVPTEESKVEKFVAGLNSEARKALTVSKPKTLIEAYLCAADLYRVQQVQKETWKSRKRSFERSVASVVMSLLVTGSESTRSLQRDGSKSGKTPQPIRNNKAKGRHSGCKNCGSGHPGVDCHGKPVECFACGKKGHRSFEVISSLLQARNQLVV
ncbi:PREDICTED: uncharacterized protein LOC109171106 [Ipomoea nil]|uniref:uncharacterized protein LOC109171106 n=1 Tax=Ipomoea nil TaxID=35883 RepID=UPI0009013E0F|nr:PREDICTED: uncharacterized protein LOC109171106 [Ipomoea nil]